MELQWPPPPPPTLSSSGSSSFPVIAIPIVGILATAILLLSYYIFVMKCCMSWRINGPPFLRRRQSISPRQETAFFATTEEPRGLDQRTIESLPIFRYTASKHRPIPDCVVCLTEFNDGELLRLLPSCSHAFHIDCIDTWLQSAVKCPLCRRHITATAPTLNDMSTRKKVNVGVSKGDECIDVRIVDEEFAGVQPLRRSISMDSSCDRQLYLSVQEFFQTHTSNINQPMRMDHGESSTSTSRFRRSFFSFRQSRSSTVLPLQIQL